MANTLRVFAAICLCCYWEGFFNFLTATIRAWEVMYDKFISLKGNCLKQFLYCVCCFGCSCFSFM